MKKIPTGTRFGRLVVKQFHHMGKKGAHWLCLCDCGNHHTPAGWLLRNGGVKSCGCLSADTLRDRTFRHGMSTRSIYSLWSMMKGRCYDLGLPKYASYGGRGIRVCERWHTFENFYADMGEKPDGMSLHRIDNDGNYSCGKCAECKANGWTSNCKWATRAEQGAAMRNNRIIEFNGKTQNLAQWAKDLNIHPETLRSRVVKYGWSVSRALTT